jgi:hypothetical protein
VVAEERSLGSYLELYTRCLEAENSMLMRQVLPTDQLTELQSWTNLAGLLDFQLYVIFYRCTELMELSAN